MEGNITFDEVVELYKKMNTEEKAQENIIELKELLALVNKLCIDIGLDKELKLNKEVVDIQKEDATLDDYLEAEFVYINEIKNYFGTFAEKIAEMFYE